MVKFFWHNGEEELATDALKYSVSQDRTADPARLVKILKEELTEGGNTMGTLVDYLTEQNKGAWLQSGRQEGESTLVIHLLKCKFKTIPERYLKQVEQANQEDLLKWAAKILKSESLKKIFEN